MASGSFGPTTAGRMDSYVDLFQAAGGSMIMLAKGNRSRQVLLLLDPAAMKTKSFSLSQIWFGCFYLSLFLGFHFDVCGIL